MQPTAPKKKAAGKTGRPPKGDSPLDAQLTFRIEQVIRDGLEAYAAKHRRERNIRHVADAARYILYKALKEEGMLDGEGEK